MNLQFFQSKRDPGRYLRDWIQMARSLPQFQEMDEHAFSEIGKIVGLMQYFGFTLSGDFGSGYGNFYRQKETHEEIVSVGIFKYPEAGDHFWLRVRPKISDWSVEGMTIPVFDGLLVPYQGRKDIRSKLVLMIEQLDQENERINDWMESRAKALS